MYIATGKEYLLKGDPYHCHCQKTARLLREKMDLSPERLIATFQSRFGPSEWLRPYTDATVKQLAQRGHMLLDPKCKVERIILEEPEQGILRPWVTSEQIHRLREHRLTDEERRFEFLETLGDPAVVLFRAVKKGNERPCVNDNVSHGASRGSAS